MLIKFLAIDHKLWSVLLTNCFIFTNFVFIYTLNIILIVIFIDYSFKKLRTLFSFLIKLIVLGKICCIKIWILFCIIDLVIQLRYVNSHRYCCYHHWYFLLKIIKLVINMLHFYIWGVLISRLVRWKCLNIYIICSLFLLLFWFPYLCAPFIHTFW